MQPEAERAAGAAQDGDASGFACPRCSVECVRHCRQGCAGLALVPAVRRQLQRSAKPLSHVPANRADVDGGGRIAAGMRGVFIQEVVFY